MRNTIGMAIYHHGGQTENAERVNVKLRYARHVPSKDRGACVCDKDRTKLVFPYGMAFRIRPPLADETAKCRLRDHVLDQPSQWRPNRDRRRTEMQ